MVRGVQDPEVGQVGLGLVAEDPDVLDPEVAADQDQVDARRQIRDLVSQVGVLIAGEAGFPRPGDLPCVSKPASSIRALASPSSVISALKSPLAATGSMVSAGPANSSRAWPMRKGAAIDSSPQGITGSVPTPRVVPWNRKNAALRSRRTPPTRWMVVALRAIAPTAFSDRRLTSSRVRV
jgi:hypothetical protein